jgi:hypothetical protein
MELEIGEEPADGEAWRLTADELHDHHERDVDARNPFEQLRDRLVEDLRGPPSHLHEERAEFGERFVEIRHDRPDHSFGG